MVPGVSPIVVIAYDMLGRVPAPSPVPLVAGTRVPNVSLQVPGLVVVMRNQPVVASPFGLPEPLSTADVVVTDVAADRRRRRRRGERHARRAEHQRDRRHTAATAHVVPRPPRLCPKLTTSAVQTNTRIRSRTRRVVAGDRLRAMVAALPARFARALRALCVRVRARFGGLPPEGHRGALPARQRAARRPPGDFEGRQGRAGGAVRRRRRSRSAGPLGHGAPRRAPVLDRRRDVGKPARTIEQWKARYGHDWRAATGADYTLYAVEVPAGRILEEIDDAALRMSRLEPSRKRSRPASGRGC